MRENKTVYDSGFSILRQAQDKFYYLGFGISDPFGKPATAGKLRTTIGICD